jgi:hypothetical protein
MNFIFFVSMISIPHKIKQALYLIKLLIVGAAFILFTINWQIAMLDWEVHYFIQEESVGSSIIFILLSVLNHFLEILKWQNLVSFL